MILRPLAGAALAVVVLAVAPAAASAAFRAYGGMTRDDQPIVLRVDPRTAKVDRVVLMFTARCRSGRTYSFGTRLNRVGGNVTLRVRTRRGGRFIAAAAAAEELAEGRVAGTGIRITGRVRGNTVTGTINAVVVIGRPESDEPDDTCTYRRRSFGAIHAPGRVLSGETSQRLPVVMLIDARARNVRALNIGWNAGCEPPGFVQIADQLARFRIRGGAFGDEFEQTFTLDDGTQRIFRYDLQGRANRLRASGTIAVEMEDRGGPAPGVCRTNTVTWRAS